MKKPPGMGASLAMLLFLTVLTVARLERCWNMSACLTVCCCTNNQTDRNFIRGGLFLRLVDYFPLLSNRLGFKLYVPSKLNLTTEKNTFARLSTKSPQKKILISC